LANIAKESGLEVVNLGLPYSIILELNISSYRMATAKDRKIRERG